jgi:hypothetical protein
MNILLAPLWIAGVVTPFLWAPLKPARFLSVGLLGATVLVFLSHGKDYYLFPVYPSLFAVGAVVLAQIRPVVRTVWLAAALIVSLIVAPIVLPILDPPVLAAYLSFSHLAPPPSEGAAGDPNRWRRGCDSVEVVGQFGVPYAMPYENARPIFICRGLRRNLSEIWGRLKRYE